MSEKMRAVRLFAPGDVRCVKVDVPDVESGDDLRLAELAKRAAIALVSSPLSRPRPATVVADTGAFRYHHKDGHPFRP